jgi:hypothetical protein
MLTLRYLMHRYLKLGFIKDKDFYQCIVCFVQQVSAA